METQMCIVVLKVKHFYASALLQKCYIFIFLCSETFSVQTFYYVQTQIIKYLDMMSTDKKEAPSWSKR